MCITYVPYCLNLQRCQPSYRGTSEDMKGAMMSTYVEWKIKIPQFFCVTEVE